MERETPLRATDTRTLTAEQLAGLIVGTQELAILDVQEAGAFANGHIFHASAAPYSRLEQVVPDLVPRRGTCIVLSGEADMRVARSAARRLGALGYVDVRVLEDGNAGWADAGQTLFQGVHVPSKTFGELVEHNYGTPSLSASELQALRDSGATVTLLDGRPFEEYRQMTIPGSNCCPNGELPLRADRMIPGPQAVVVTNCAGRTRSIIGAETLRRLGIANPVYALRNGTQGWMLAGMALERGAVRSFDMDIPQDALDALRERSEAVARRFGVPRVAASTLAQWLADPGRTTYLFDVRTPEEYASGTLPAAVHAPGGQLIQATDLWMAVAKARVVVFDEEGVRAPVIAAWLREMGFDCHVLAEVPPEQLVRRSTAAAPMDSLPALPASEAAGWRIVDLRSSAQYRAGHHPGAVWSTRSRLDRVIQPGDRVALVSPDEGIASLAAIDAMELGASEVRLLAGATHACVTPDDPRDEDRVDFMFFTAGRHEGNRQAAQQYLDWEVNLVRQLGPLEWARFPETAR